MKTGHKFILTALIQSTYYFSGMSFLEVNNCSNK